MIRRLLVGAAACVLLALPVAGAAPPAVAARPLPAATTAVNLLGNPSFEAVIPDAPPGWTCSAGVATGEDLPGSEFIQLMPPDSPEAPVLTGVTFAGAAKAAAPKATPQAAPKAAAVVAGPTAVAITGEEPRTWLEGTPTRTDNAGCTQVVPVRRGATYTLSVLVSGPAVLGTEYGEVSGPGGASLTELTTTFTVAPHADAVRVHIHGRFGGDGYQAMNAALVGPPSATRSPAVPTGLAPVRHTSRWIELQWLAASGAGGYEVRLDGTPLATVEGTSALVLGLRPGQQFTVAVVAVNGARPSAPGAAVTMFTSPAFAAPPAAPEWNTVDVWPNADDTWRADLDFWAPDTATDGYFVYLDGVRVGWLFGSPGVVPTLAPGPHTLRLSAVNSAGESVLSEPFDIVAG